MEEFFFRGPVDLAVAAFSSLKRTCSRLSGFRVSVAAFSTRRYLAAGKLLLTAFVEKVGFVAAEFFYFEFHGIFSSIVIVMAC